MEERKSGEREERREGGRAFNAMGVVSLPPSCPPNLPTDPCCCTATHPTPPRRLACMRRVNQVNDAAYHLLPTHPYPSVRPFCRAPNQPSPTPSPRRVYQVNDVDRHLPSIVIRSRPADYAPKPPPWHTPVSKFVSGAKPTHANQPHAAHQTPTRTLPFAYLRRVYHVADAGCHIPSLEVRSRLPDNAPKRLPLDSLVEICCRADRVGLRAIEVYKSRAIFVLIHLGACDRFEGKRGGENRIHEN